MSIKVMSAVWENEHLTMGEKFVLLALADHADDDGNCYPSIARLCRRTCMTDRGVQKVISRLSERGFLFVQPNKGRSGSNLYTITPERGSPPNIVHPRTAFTTPPNVVPKTPEPCSPKPSVTINEPSFLEAAPPKKAKRKPEVPLPDDWVPSEKNIADAEASHFTAQEISHESDRFRNYHLAKGSLFRDWDAAWRTWLGNARKFGPRGGVAGSTQPFRGGQGASLASIVAQRRIAGIV